MKTCVFLFSTNKKKNVDFWVFFTVCNVIYTAEVGAVYKMISPAASTNYTLSFCYFLTPMGIYFTKKIYIFPNPSYNDFFPQVCTVKGSWNFFLKVYRGAGSRKFYSAETNLKIKKDIYYRPRKNFFHSLYPFFPFSFVFHLLSSIIMFSPKKFKNYMLEGGG